MFRAIVRVGFGRFKTPCLVASKHTTAQEEKQSKPLRILFCGSDELSSACLKSLHKEHQTYPETIASIDVLCRPGKPSGRSLKRIRERMLFSY